jgi:hypothetical protein
MAFFFAIHLGIYIANLIEFVSNLVYRVTPYARIYTCFLFEDR